MVHVQNKQREKLSSMGIWLPYESSTVAISNANMTTWVFKKLAKKIDYQDLSKTHFQIAKAVYKIDLFNNFKPALLHIFRYMCYQTVVKAIGIFNISSTTTEFKNIYLYIWCNNIYYTLYRYNNQQIICTEVKALKLVHIALCYSEH